MTATFTERTAARRRAELIDAAAGLVAEQGWAGLRMQRIADRVGISRQTVYNEFGTKEGLAGAIALRVADDLLDRAEAAIDAASGASAVWEGAVRAVLEAAEVHPVMTRARSAADDGGLLRHFIGERPLIQRARERLTPLLRERMPETDPARLDSAVEAGIRLTISHFFLPLHPPAVAAARTAPLLAGLVEPGRRATPRPR